MQTYLHNRQQTCAGGGSLWGGSGGKDCKRYLLGVMEMIISEVMFSLVYAYAKTYHIVYCKYVQFIECQLYLSKAAFMLKHKFLFVICLISDSFRCHNERTFSLMISPPVAGSRWVFSKPMVNEKKVVRYIANELCYFGFALVPILNTWSVCRVS